MKRNRFLCALFLISLSLCFLSGCATKEECIAKQVDTINEWRVQNNKDDNEYLLFFHFEDKNREQVITPVSLDVTITNDNDEIVYQSTFELSTEDYSEWSSPAKGDEILPTVSISRDDIQAGSIKTGTLQFDAWYEDCFSFSDISEKIDDLPTIPLENEAQSPAEAAQGSTPKTEASAPAQKDINKFLSAFSEQYLTACAANCNDPSDMINFGFTNIQMHHPEDLTYDDDGTVYANAVELATVVKYFFGIAVTPISTGWLEYYDGQYSALAGNPPAISCISIAEYVTPIGDGKFNVTFKLYSPNSGNASAYFAATARDAAKASGLDYAGYGSAVVKTADDGLNLIRYEATYK